MNQYILYCRAGFERDCAAEIQFKAAEVGLYGFCRTQENQAYVEFELTQETGTELFSVLKLDDLIFTRQWFKVIEKLEGLAETDRISPIIKSLIGYQFSDIRMEYPETNQGKEIAGFAKKFTVPLRQALKKQTILTDNTPQNLHLFMFSSTHLILGMSLQNNASDLLLGIRRLKFPADGPSRSTLKLEEAFHQFIPKKEWETRLSSGLNAVDLGAAPGGWTYQLVKKGMMVSAIDNGPMADSLMETGQVKHFKEDGFKYQPKKQNVHWLVCDMVEKPSRVARLMTKWVENNWCKEAIFNLKLPMKQRFQNVQQVLEETQISLYEAGVRYELKAKHLYHDREEITCLLRRLD
ncbi:23S rRNA (cytidine(2498)-2'-O)-methyltransferase RlmM [Catenovulum sp. 2E275]|uniref:23S rRNA (cytidine(2498)-2'-O)-methyltransferase RlmM n=1 Tax=Catenovulum sp. 2E275 TaxID=2980497 RepID=UPI003974BEB2